MSQHPSTEAFREIPSTDELRKQVEEAKRREAMASSGMQALPAVPGHEAGVIEGTYGRFNADALLKGQRAFIRAQVAFQHDRDLAALVYAQKNFAEVLEGTIHALDYKKLAGIQETYVNMLSVALEELGVL